MPSICSNARWEMSCRSAILNRRDKMGFPVPLKSGLGRNCGNSCRIYSARKPPKHGLL